METIYRQKEQNYKSAVSDISKRNVSKAFTQLDAMGAIQETDCITIAETLTKDYLKIRDDKKSALVISPTREQARKIKKDIREGLRRKGIVKICEKIITVYDDLHYAEAQKKDPRQYTQGDIIQAHQNMKGIRRGERLEVYQTKKGKVILHTHTRRNFKSITLRIP